jgi:putative Holliday junction resolvase
MTKPRKPPRPGRKLLGLDLGERRIGVAVADDTGLIAAPHSIIDLRRTPLAAVAELARRLQVDGVVVGLPTSLSGDEGHQAREVRTMTAEIEQALDVPVVFWDERLTTAIADRLLQERERSPRKRREQRDAVAAAILLQDYLDAHPIRRSLPLATDPEHDWEDE